MLGRHAPQRLAPCVLHLWVLTTLAISQPLYDLLGRNLEFLVAYDIRSYVPFAVALSLLPALPPVAILLASRLASPRIGWRIQVGLVALLLATLVLPPLHRILPGAPSLVVACVLGATGAAAYARLRVARLFASVLTPAIVVLPVFFLMLTPVHEIFSMADDMWPKGAAPKRKPTVVLVVFDALPLFSLLDENAEIDAKRLPSFAAFAREATWFRNASSIADSTVRAVPAILTGRYPRADRLPIYEHHVQSLFTILNGHYAMWAFESVTQICPPVLCEASAPTTSELARMTPMFSDLVYVYLHFLLPEAWRAGLPDVSSSWKHFGFANRVDPGADAAAGAEADAAATLRVADPVREFEHFLDGIGSHEDASLHFLHLDLPHSPWRYLPSGRRYRPGTSTYPCCRDGKGSWVDDSEIADRALQRYLLQLGFVDRLVGRLMARLEETGVAEDALVILTADHGENFWPGRLIRMATPETALEVLGVPLLIRGPGFEPGVVTDRNVETVDILPTIADTLGVPLPKPVDGRSLLDSNAPERPVKLAFRPRADGEMRRIELDPRLTDWSENQQRMRDTFGRNDDGLDLFALGPRRELVGRSVETLTIDDAGHHAVEVDAIESFADVRLAGPILPVLVSGRFAVNPGQGGEPALRVAVAVNGVIRAVVESFTADAELRFEAMIAESALREGANRVEIFVVRGPGGTRPRLEPTLLR